MSFDPYKKKTDKKALYVRMLGDMKTRTKVELTNSSIKRRTDSLTVTQMHKDLTMIRIKDPLELEGLELMASFLPCNVAARKRRYSSSANASGDLHTKYEAQSSRGQQRSTLLDTHYSMQANMFLSSVNIWSFNVFTLDQLSNGRSLFHMCLHLFQEYDFIRTFKLDVVKLMRCISLIEAGYYSSNPYHNAMHAADVVQAMHCNLLEAKISKYLQPAEKMAAILSAAGHDLYHPGVNQAFLVATRNPLAALYHNSSVLENHHWQSLVAVIRESKVFDHLPIDTWLGVKSHIRSMILATDITKQHEILAVFREHLNTGSLNLESNPSHRTFIMQIALKCADICNPCRPWFLSKRWSELICQEFFSQGDRERKLALPVAPACDRNLTTVAKIQNGFMTFVVEPLFTEWSRYAANDYTDSMLHNLHANKANWNSFIAIESAKMEEVTIAIPPAAVIAGLDGHVNSALQLDFDVNDKENADPFDARDLGHCVNLDCQYRRHSLPTDTLLPPPPVVSASRFSMKGIRRFSLPISALFPAPGGNGIVYASGCGKPSLLASLAESSPILIDETSSRFNFGRTWEVRRCSLNDANLSGGQRVSPRQSGVRHTGNAGHLVVLNTELNQMLRGTTSENTLLSIGGKSGLGNCVPPKQYSLSRSTSSSKSSDRSITSSDRPQIGHGRYSGDSESDACLQRQPLISNNIHHSASKGRKNTGNNTESQDKFRRSSLAQTAVDSLAAAEPPTDNGRQRSCSLATSTLPTIEPFVNSLKPVLSVQNSHRRGLLGTARTKDCLPKNINSLQTHRPVKPVQFVTKPMKCCSGRELKPEDSMTVFGVPAASTPVRRLPPSLQPLCSTTSSPITRLVDVHCRPPKGVARRAVTMVSILNDREFVPLLRDSAAVDATLHEC